MLGVFLRLVPALWLCLGETAEDGKQPRKTDVLIFTYEAGRLLDSIIAGALDPASDFSSSGTLALTSLAVAEELEVIVAERDHMNAYRDTFFAFKAFSKGPLTWTSTVELSKAYPIWRTITTDRWFRQLMDMTSVMFALLYCPMAAKSPVPDSYKQLVEKGSRSIAGDGIARHVMQLSELRGRHTCDRTCLLDCATCYAALALHAAHAGNVGDVARLLDAAQDVFLAAGILRLSDAFEIEEGPALSALWGLLAALTGTSFVKNLQVRTTVEAVHETYPKVIHYAVPELTKPCPKANAFAPLPPQTALQIYRAVDTVGRVLSWHGVVWFASHGTLLGAWRHKGIIPHDCDADITVTEEGAKLLRTAPVLDSLLRNGFEVSYRPGQNLFAIFRVGVPTTPAGWVPQGYTSVEPHLDIYVLWRTGKGDNTYYEYLSNQAIHKKFFAPFWYLFPTRSAPFGTSVVRVPQHPEFYLNMMYGPDWNEMVRAMSANVPDLNYFVAVELGGYARRMALPAGPLREVELPVEAATVDTGVPDFGK